MDRICIICGKPVPDGSDLMDRFGVHHDIHASCWPEVARLAAELTEGKREAEYLANLLWERHYKNESPNFEKLNTIAGVVSQIDNMIAGLIEERDQALARAAAAAMDMRERAAEHAWNKRDLLADAEKKQIDAGLTGRDYYGRRLEAELLSRSIRALPIDPDAQKALDKLLAQAREDAIREAADIVNKNRDISGWVSHDSILALLNDGGRDE